MKKIAWFNGKKIYFVLAYRKWYAYIPFLKPTKGSTHPFICTSLPPKWFGKLPKMFSGDPFFILPLLTSDRIIPIVYRREK